MPKTRGSARILRLTDVDTANSLTDLRKITANQIALLKDVSGARAFSKEEASVLETLARVVRLTEAQADAEEARTRDALGELTVEERRALEGQARALLAGDPVVPPDAPGGRRGS